MEWFNVGKIVNTHGFGESSCHFIDGLSGRTF